jgi:Spy/CpxP family protein refolding chaperone
MYEDLEDDEPRSRFLPGFALGVGVALLIVGLLGAAWAAHAHGGGWRSHGRDWRFGAEWMLRWVDASPEQEDRILAIVGAAEPDFAALCAQHEATHAAWTTVLGAEVVDRAALESLRVRELVAADAASQRLVATLADVAEVLTPEQRAELLRAVARFHRRD